MEATRLREKCLASSDVNLFSVTLRLEERGKSDGRGGRKTRPVGKGERRQRRTVRYKGSERKRGERGRE